MLLVDLQLEREADRLQDVRLARILDRVLAGPAEHWRDALLEVANRLATGDADGAMSGEPDYVPPPSSDRITPTPPEPHK